MTQSQITKLLNTLKTGKKMSAKAIASRFKLANPSAAINTLRSRGYRIVNSQTPGKGPGTYYLETGKRS